MDQPQRQVSLDRAAELNTVRALGDLVSRRWQVPLTLRARRDELSKDELAAPIELDGKPLGWVVAPQVPSKPDGQYLKELLETAAAEIVAYHRSVDEQAAGPASLPLNNRYDYSKIIGRSASMRQLYALMDKVIDVDSTVLIEGENGTGKELIAQAIHYNSRRKDRPFVVQNCSAFNDNLLDSELFGHKKGAFTGAVADKLGLFAVADGGTFFLDEIGDMSPSLQVKLLRVLQEGSFIPVGDTQPQRVDVRIIAATNRDLRTLMAQGTFREDLFYRVNVINITPPPLRERADDIPLLIEHFLAQQADSSKTLTSEARALLKRYRWPGNVRELENEIERLAVLASDGEQIGVNMLSARISHGATVEPSEQLGSSCLPDALTNLERTMIKDVLGRHHGNKTRAALELQISRRNLIRKVQKYQLDAQD